MKPYPSVSSYDNVAITADSIILSNNQPAPSDNNVTTLDKYGLRISDDVNNISVTAVACVVWTYRPTVLWESIHTTPVGGLAMAA